MDLTSGSLFKNILKFSVPLMFSNLLQVMFNMADVAVVGKFAGPEALGAVGSTPQFLFLFIGLAMGMGQAVNVTAAFYLGQKNDSKIRHTVHTAFFLCLFYGILICCISQVIARPVLEGMKTKEEFLDGAVLYLRIILLGIPAMTMFNYGSGLFSAKGDNKTPMVFLGISGVVNILLNLFFVIVLKMDVEGVALASVISEYISAVLVLWPVAAGKWGIKFDLSALKMDKTLAFNLLKIGVPAGLQNAIFAIANIFVQEGVNRIPSPGVVQGNAASSNFDPINYNLMNAFYTAGASFIGQNYGAGNKKRVLNSYLISMFYAFGISFVLGTVIYFAGEQFMTMFVDLERPESVDIIFQGCARFKIMAFSYCVSAFMDATIAGCRGLGKTIIPSVFVFLGSCVFRIIWVKFIFDGKTIGSLFLLYVFSWAVTAVMEILYFAVLYKNIPDDENSDSGEETDEGFEYSLKSDGTDFMDVRSPCEQPW